LNNVDAEGEESETSIINQTPSKAGPGEDAEEGEEDAAADDDDEDDEDDEYEDEEEEPPLFAKRVTLFYQKPDGSFFVCIRFFAILGLYHTRI